MLAEWCDTVCKQGETGYMEINKNDYQCEEDPSGMLTVSTFFFSFFLFFTLRLGYCVVPQHIRMSYIHL